MPADKTSRHRIPTLVMVLLAMFFVLLLFGTRLLNKPKADADAAEVRYSERYYELSKLPNPSAVEKAELELETCRFQRNRIDFLKGKPLANYESELADYLRDCEKILPLQPAD